MRVVGFYITLRFWMFFETQGTIRSCCDMQSEMNKGNAMKYSDFSHWFFVSLVLAVCAARGLAEPADQVNQQEGNKEEKIQQKAREEYAGLWRIETITSKGDTTEPDKRIAFDNKTDGTWVLFIDDKELSSVQILLLRFVIQRKLIFLLQVVKAKEKFCREFMRLKSQYSDSVFEVVMVRDQKALSRFMVTKVLWLLLFASNCSLIVSKVYH